MQDNITTKQNEFRGQFQIIGFAFILITLFVSAQDLYAVNMNECLMEALKSADDSVTVGQLREQCQQETGTVSKEEPQDNSAEIGSNGPVEMVLKTSQAKKPAYFPHEKHQGKYSCGTCHHGKSPSGKLVKYTEKTVISNCSTCHNADMPNEELNDFQSIGHKLCRECHRKNQNITSAKCSTCHLKNL